MKYMKIFRSPMLVAGLASPLFFALPTRAQQEVDPVHFEIRAVEAAPVAKAALEHKPRQIAAARAHRPGAPRTSAKGLVAFIADGSTSPQLSGHSLNNARATASRKASAQNRARKATKIASIANNE